MFTRTLLLTTALIATTVSTAAYAQTVNGNVKSITNWPVPTGNITQVGANNELTANARGGVSGNTLTVHQENGGYLIPQVLVNGNPTKTKNNGAFIRAMGSNNDFTMRQVGYANESYVNQNISPVGPNYNYNVIKVEQISPETTSVGLTGHNKQFRGNKNIVNVQGSSNWVDIKQKALWGYTDGAGEDIANRRNNVKLTVNSNFASKKEGDYSRNVTSFIDQAGARNNIDATITNTDVSDTDQNFGSSFFAAQYGLDNTATVVSNGATNQAYVYQGTDNYDGVAASSDRSTVKVTQQRVDRQGRTFSVNNSYAFSSEYNTSGNRHTITQEGSNANASINSFGADASNRSSGNIYTIKQAGHQTKSAVIGYSQFEGPARITGSNNIATITQNDGVGKDSSAKIYQKGNGNQAYITQNAGIAVTGKGTAVIEQLGSNNFASISQLTGGSVNGVARESSATIIQKGDWNKAAWSDGTGSNTLNLTQNGDDKFNMRVIGRGNTITVNQLGNSRLGAGDNFEGQLLLGGSNNKVTVVLQNGAQVGGASLKTEGFDLASSNQTPTTRLTFCGPKGCGR